MDRGNSLVEKKNKEGNVGVGWQKYEGQRKECNSNNYLFIQQLLKLEERWIIKQAEIRKYVNGLQKTIKQRDMKIEMIEMENASLRERLQREINQNKEVRNSMSYAAGVDKMQSTSKKKAALAIQRTVMMSVQNNDRKKRLQKVMVCNEKVYNQVIQTQKAKPKIPMFQQNLINETYSPMKEKKENLERSKRKKLKLSSNRYDQFYLGKAVEISPVRPIKNESQQPEIKQKHTFSFSQQANSTIIPQINESEMEKRIMDNIAKILKENSFIPYQSQQRKVEVQVNPVRESRYKEEPKKIIIPEDEVNERPLKGVGGIEGTKSVLYYEIPNNSNVYGKTSKVIADNNKSGVILNSSGIGLDKSFQTTEQLQSMQSSSCMNFDEPTLATIMKKDRGVHQRTINEQIYGQKVSRVSIGQGPMMIINETRSKIQSGQEDSDEEKTPKKYDISCMTVIENQLPKGKQARHQYKSSKTITFNDESQRQYLSNLRNFQQHDFHSQNKLILPHNIDIECGSLSPYESAQQTPYQSPQGSSQMIKYKGGDAEQQEKISQVGTVKRNPTMSNKQVQQRQIRNKLELKNPYSFQLKSSENNKREVAVGSQSKHNLSSQKVYEESINISPISEKNSSQKMDADKKSINVSEDDPFSQLIEETNRSKLPMASQRNEVEQQQGTATEHLLRSNFQRKRTRFNTKLTNLEYSLTESNVSLSEFDGSGMYGERENSNTNINKRSQLEIHRLSVVQPIEQEVRNERESFKVDYEDNAVQVESEVEVRTSGNFGSNRLTNLEKKKTESSQEKVSSKGVSEESQRDMLSITKKQSDPKQHTMKLHGRATLLLQHNSQTEPAKEVKQEIKSKNELKPVNSTKKIPISSSQDSKLYNSNKQHQSEKQNKKEIPMKRNVQECNIKIPSSIDLASETSSKQKQKKFVDTSIQYEQSNQPKKVESHSVYDHIRQQQQKPKPFLSPKNPSKSLIISYDRSNISSEKANDSRANNDGQRNNVQYNFKKTPKVYDSDAKNHNRSESYIEQSTKMKQPYFDQGQYECYTESNKSNKSAPFEEVSRFTEGRPRLSAKERNAPDSKSTTLNNFRTQGANSYVTKPVSSSSSEHINTHAFKKMHKFTTQSQEQSQYERQSQKQRTQFEQFPRQRLRQRQRQPYPSYYQQITPNTNIDGILFQNSMLRSYNRTLQSKVKKPSNTEKLMQKLNTQNFSVRNKIHKKSIY